MNLNAAPLDHAGYATVKAAGIGTYQIFQETYHHETYGRVHPRDTRKGNYLWRLDGVARAMEVRCDDVGIGALFGLYDWRFEVLALVAHALHLQKHYNVGPHTISFPRLRPASGVHLDETWLVDDERLQAAGGHPAAGGALHGPDLHGPRAARAPPRGAWRFGVSQIDAGSRIELGGYTEAGDAQVMEREQFELGDIRPLGRRDARADDRRLHAQFLHRLLPAGPHRRALHGVRHSRLHPEHVHAQRPDHADGIPGGLRLAGDLRPPASRVIQQELDKLPEGPRKQELSGSACSGSRRATRGICISSLLSRAKRKWSRADHLTRLT